MRPGKFIQVELMLKDAHRYKDTEGWGWGRWRGLDLKPYGEDARFVNECTSCHRPMRGNDYVYTLPITTAKVNREEVVNNSAAALPMSLPYQPLSWSTITMYVDPRTHTMATLYGNDTAMQGVQADGAAPVGGPKGPAYPVGAVLALVTWLQREQSALVRSTHPRRATIGGVRAGGSFRADEQLPALRRHGTHRGSPRGWSSGTAGELRT
jgi:Cytochrome P460